MRNIIEGTALVFAIVGSVVLGVGGLQDWPENMLLTGKVVGLFVLVFGSMFTVWCWDQGIYKDIFKKGPII